VEIDKEKAVKKWATVLDSLNVSGDSKREWLSEYAEMHTMYNTPSYSDCFSGPIDTGSTLSTGNTFDWSKPLLPMSMRISATTIGSGGWIKSKKQQLKENRINKLRKLKGKKPNVVLPNDEFVQGIVSVKPLSAPTGQLFFMDFKYTPRPSIKEIRKKKLQKLLRKQKLKYIHELIQKII